MNEQVKTIIELLNKNFGKNFLEQLAGRELSETELIIDSINLLLATHVRTYVHDLGSDLDDQRCINSQINLIKQLQELGITLNPQNFIYQCSGQAPHLAALQIIGMYRNAGLEDPRTFIDKRYDTEIGNVTFDIFHTKNGKVVSTLESKLLEEFIKNSSPNNDDFKEAEKIINSSRITPGSPGLIDFLVNKYSDHGKLKTFIESYQRSLASTTQTSIDSAAQNLINKYKGILIERYASLIAACRNNGIVDVVEMGQILANDEVKTISCNLMAGTNKLPALDFSDKLISFTMQAMVNKDGTLAGFNWSNTSESAQGKISSFLKSNKGKTSVCISALGAHPNLYGIINREEMQTNPELGRSFLIYFPKQASWSTITEEPGTNSYNLSYCHPSHISSARVPLDLHKKGREFGIERFLNEVIHFPANQEDGLRSQLKEEIIAINQAFFEEIVKNIGGLKYGNRFSRITIEECQSQIANYLNPERTGTINNDLIDILKKEEAELMPKYSAQILDSVFKKGCKCRIVLYDLVAQYLPAIIENKPEFEELFTKYFGEFQAIVIPKDIDAFFKENDVSPELQGEFFKELRELMSKDCTLAIPHSPRQQSAAALGAEQNIGAERQ